MKEKIEQYEKELDSIRAKINQLKGKREILMDRLRNEFDCSTVDEAVELLETLKADIVVQEENYAKAIEEFERTYREKLGIAKL